MNQNNENNPNGPRVLPLTNSKEETPLQTVVLSAMDANQYNQYYPILCENHITPKMILKLTNEEWSDMGIKSIGVKRNLRDAATQFLDTERDAARNTQFLDTERTTESLDPHLAQFMGSFPEMDVESLGRGIDPTLQYLLAEAASQGPASRTTFTDPTQPDPDPHLGLDAWRSFASVRGGTTVFNSDPPPNTGLADGDDDGELQPFSQIFRDAPRHDNTLQSLVAEVATKTATEVAAKITSNQPKSAVDDDWFQAHAEQTRRAQNATKSAHTFNHVGETIVLYDYKLRAETGLSFAEEDPDVVARKMIDYIQSSTTMCSSSKGTKLEHLLSTFTVSNKSVSVRMKKVVREAIQLYKKKGRHEKEANKQNATGAPITARDNMHVLNSLIVRYRGFDSGAYVACGCCVF